MSALVGAGRPRPLVGLVAGPPVSEAARRFVVALARHAEVRSSGRCVGPPDLVVAAGPGAADRAQRAQRDGAGAPVVVWVETAGDHCPSGALAVGPGAGSPGVVVHRAATEIQDLWPLPPLVRERWRRRLGLPSHWVVDLATLDAPDRGTASALASAVVADTADAADLVRALALGTPTVTSVTAAHAIGVDSAHVSVVADQATPAERLDAATHLAEDPHRAARLATAARRRVEQTLDLDHAAVTLLARVAAIADAARRPAPDPVATARDLVAELGAPAGSLVLRRLADATHLFVLDPPVLEPSALAPVTPGAPT